MIMTVVEFVRANKSEARHDKVAPSRRTPTRPRTEVNGEADRAPHIDPSVNTATMRPNLDD